MSESLFSDLKPGLQSAIKIDRAPDGDTNVQFAVPIREVAPPTGQEAPPPARPKRSLRVLCIDDDPQVRELLNDCLTFFDHQVMVAAGGEEGIGLFRTAVLNHEPYEAVITDLGMPDIDGRQVARTIKAESPGTPVIMMTGWGNMAKEDGETAPSVDIVVSKPPRMQELNDLLFRMVALIRNPAVS